MLPSDRLPHPRSGDLQAKMDRYIVVIERAMKLKRVMLKKGLRKAKAKCPEEDCSGHLNGILNPNRRSQSGFHLHMRCDGTCGTVFME